MLASREEELLPPHLDHVVDALADAAVVDAVELAPDPGQLRKLRGRVRRPDVVAALEVREAVMREVMADFPEAVRGQRRQERDSADPFVERLVGRIGAMAGIVTDDEQARYPQSRHERRENLHPPGLHDEQARDGHPEHEPIQQEPDEGRGDAPLDGERLQHFLEFEARLFGRRRGGFSFGCGSYLHSGTPAFTVWGGGINKVTAYYTPVQAIHTELRWIRPSRHRARAERPDAHRPRSERWQPPGCWHPAACRASGARSGGPAGSGRRARCRTVPGKALTHRQIRALGRWKAHSAPESAAA